MLDSRNRALELNVAAAWKRSVRSVRFSKAPQQVKMGHQEIVGVLRELVVLCRAFGVDLQRRFRCIKGRYRVVAGVWGRQMAKGRYRTIPASTRRLMTKPIVRDPIYRRRRFDAEVIELCVRWYITYRLSYRDLVAMMAERGIAVSHTTIHRWVIRYVPEFEKRWNRFARPVNTSWRVDETYIKIRGKWNYLYRAVDKHGKTVDFLLRPDRGIAAAQAFFRKALSSNFPRWPRKITLDGYVPSHRALGLLRREDPKWKYVEARSNPYLNNLVEQDHRAIKRRCAAMVGGFRSFGSAAITLTGIELAHRIRKRQFSFGRGRYHNVGSLKQIWDRALA